MWYTEEGVYRLAQEHLSWKSWHVRFFAPSVETMHPFFIVCNVPSICNTLDVVVTLPCPLASSSCLSDVSQRNRSYTSTAALRDIIWTTGLIYMILHAHASRYIGQNTMSSHQHCYILVPQKDSENPSVYRARPPITDDWPVRRFLYKLYTWFMIHSPLSNRP